MAETNLKFHIEADGTLIIDSTESCEYSFTLNSHSQDINKIKKIDFNRLPALDAYITINGLPNLEEINFGSLKRSYNIHITKNPKLSKINFSELRHIQGHLDLRGNILLKEIDLAQILKIDKSLCLSSKSCTFRPRKAEVVGQVFKGNVVNEKLTNILRRG